MSEVTQYAPASPMEAAAHFRKRLSLETDCSDVYEALKAEQPDFILLDVRGRSSFRSAHVPGAINLPHREIGEETLSRWPADAAFVVYCAGPHCNGGDKAALALSNLGRSVKLMIGGVAGWADEGFAFAVGDGDGDANAVSSR